MNEVSNFATNAAVGASLTCPKNKWDDPPYETSIHFPFFNELITNIIYNLISDYIVASHVGPIGATVGARLSDNTICMVTKLGENGEYLNYEVHNLYGYRHAIATQKYFALFNFSIKI